MSVPVLSQKTFFGKRRHRVAVLRMPQQSAMARHRHEFCEIVLVLSGTAVHVTGEFRREIGAGEVLVINSRRAHGYERTQRLNLVNLLIHAEVLARIERQLRDVSGYHVLFNTQASRWRRPEARDRIQLSTTERVQVEEWIARVEEETQSDTPENALIAEAYLALIVGLIARRYRSGAERRLVPPMATGRAGGIGPVVSWIEQNLEQPIRVGELARKAGLSERSFYRAFRDVMGCAPVEYVLQARLRRAGEMLREPHGRSRVEEIAQACGFVDSNYFSACFRRFKGCSPSAFRREASR